LLPNHLFTGFCLSFLPHSPSFLEPLYKQAFQRIWRGFFRLFFGEASCIFEGSALGFLEAVFPTIWSCFCSSGCFPVVFAYFSAF
jgi:hypothetical protein